MTSDYYGIKIVYVKKPDLEHIVAIRNYMELMAAEPKCRVPNVILNFYYGAGNRRMDPETMICPLRFPILWQRNKVMFHASVWRLIFIRVVVAGT